MNKLRVFVLSFLLIFLFALAIPRNVNAQTTPTIGANLNAYVAPTGSECNINVPTQYATIQAGVDAANSGDTICVAAGTFNENVVIDKSITLAGRGVGQSVINGLNQSYDIYGVSTLIILNGSSNNIVVEGFKIIGARGSEANDSSILLLGGSTPVNLQYNHVVSGNGGFAVYTPYIRSNDVFQNNILEGNNSNQVFVISHNGPGENDQILNNTFTGTVAQTNVSDSGTVFTFGAKDSVINRNVFNTLGTVLAELVVNYTPNVVTENNVYSLGLSGGNSTPLNAENNWWGSSDQSVVESHIGSQAGAVDFQPFATAPFPEYPLLSNANPVVGSITASTNPVLINTSITASSNFTDPDLSDTHTASWNWGDGNVTNGTVVESNGSGSVSDSHTYTTAGVYTITLTVTDNHNGSGTLMYQYLSVYNPTPQGLFSGARIFTDPSTNGKVMFGVSTKYSGSSPTGKVNMNLKSSNLDFASTSISTLVIANGMATARGAGTLNGVSGYTFLVTGADSSQTVRFQIKNSANNVVYDSQPSAPDAATPLTSITGQIVVH